MSNLKIQPLIAGFGAEVIDADLAQLDDGLVDAVLDTLAEHALLLFRRQSLDDAELAALAKALGPVGIASKRSCLAPGHPEGLSSRSSNGGSSALQDGPRPGRPKSR